MTAFRRRWLRGLAALAALMAGLVFAVAAFKDHAQLHTRRNILSGLCFACKLYASDHGGVRPPDLRVMFPQYVSSPWYFDYATKAVDYFPGATDETNPTTVLMCEKQPDARGRRWVGHVDCSVELEQPASNLFAPRP